VLIEVSNGARSLHISSVLKDGRLSPASKRLEVVEIRLSIVVGPPEGILANSIPINSHDRLP
ncbi:hypothetical protein PENTCL1PPCAC_2104, partial [Pristionchus entomophagus]